MRNMMKLIGLSFALATSTLLVPGLMQSAWVSTAMASEQETEQTQAFSIEKMTCAACPITVKKAMQRVDGVKNVDIDFESKTAIATFDPRLTNGGEIAAASTNVGYPAIAIDNSQ